TPSETMTTPWVACFLVIFALPPCIPQPHRSRHHLPEPHAEAYHMARDPFDPHRDSEEFRRDAPDDKRDFSHKDNQGEEPLVIQTKKGKVRGLTLTAATGKKIDAWMGIPYAQNPQEI
ncbi:hypothetical protein HHI36_006335, partial [Cryptolaemus montrouzieri]